MVTGAKPVFCGQCGAKNAQGAGFCGECGAQVQDGVKFCQGCGAAVEIPVENNAQQAQPQQATPQNDFSNKFVFLSDTTSPSGVGWYLFHCIKNHTIVYEKQ